MRGSGGVEGGALAAMRLAAELMPKVIRAWTRTALEACEGVDVITGGIGGMAVALSVAEKLGRPFIESHLQPVGAPTDAYPGALFARVPRWLGAWGVRASHRLTELGVWMPFRGAMDGARREVLGLSGRPTAADGQPVLYGFSRRVVPVPPSPERARHVTGYWTLPAPEGWSPPPALDAFLPAAPSTTGRCASGRRRSARRSAQRTAWRTPCPASTRWRNRATRVTAWSRMRPVFPRPRPPSPSAPRVPKRGSRTADSAHLHIVRPDGAPHLRRSVRGPRRARALQTMGPCETRER